MDEKVTVYKKNAPVWTAYLIGFCLLWELQRWISFPAGEDIYPWIQIGELFLVGAVFYLIRFRENPWYIALLAGVPVLFLSSALQGAEVLEKTTGVLRKSVLAYALCPAAAPLLLRTNMRDMRDWKRFVMIFAAVWVVIFSALSITGIYAAFSGIQIPSFNGDYFIGLAKNGTLRLWTGSNATTAALLAVSVCLAVLGAGLCERIIFRVLYCLALLPLIFCLILTGSVAEEIGALAALGIALVCLLQRRIRGLIRPGWLRGILAALLILVIIFGGVMLCDAAKQGLDSAISSRASKAESSALADFWNQRVAVWGEALSVFGKNPGYLLTGISVPRLMEVMKELTNIPNVSHLQSTYLQILCSTGVVGLLMALFFTFMVVRSSIKLMSNPNRPMWEKLICLPALGIIIMGTVDSFRLTNQADIVSILTLFGGGAIVTARAAASRRRR